MSCANPKCQCFRCMTARTHRYDAQRACFGISLMLASGPVTPDELGTAVRYAMGHQREAVALRSLPSGMRS